MDQGEHLLEQQCNLMLLELIKSTVLYVLLSFMKHCWSFKT